MDPTEPQLNISVKFWSWAGVLEAELWHKADTGLAEAQRECKKADVQPSQREGSAIQPLVRTITISCELGRPGTKASEVHDDVRFLQTS